MKTTTDRKQHWEQVYETRSPQEVSWFQSYPKLSLDFILKSNIDKNQRLIDIGGGASILVDHLIEKGFNEVSVLDISEKALQHSKERLKEKAKQITWYVEDILNFTAPHKFDLWHDRAVFHFLTDEQDRKQYIKILKENLNYQGYIIIATFGRHGLKQCSNLPVQQHDEQSILNEFGQEFTLLETVDEIHFTPKNIQQQFTYFHLQLNGNK